MPVFPDIQMNGRTLPMLWRGYAIGSYASLESSLCSLLAVLLGVDVPKAGIIFYRVVNTRSRNAIISDLLKRAHGENYKEFWNSVIKLIRQLDSERNEIAHWHFVLEIGDEGGPEIDLGDVELGTNVLYPPNSWLAADVSSKKTHADLAAFSGKCDFVSRAINVFATTLSPPETIPPDALESWRDICRQELPYPPPDTHPLSRNYKEPGSPPQSSEG
jgi:hypothetical protein